MTGNERLSQPDCDIAIKLCKQARPMADMPTTKVFPIISRLCCCFYRDQKKSQHKEESIDKLADVLLKNVSQNFF